MDTGIGGRLVNGEAVEVEVRHAGIGSRMLAFLIDVALQAMLAALLFVVGALVALAQWPDWPGTAARAGLLTLGTLLVFVGYPAAVETLSAGRSVGKLAMGLRVVRADGGPIRFRHALTRALVGMAVEWPGLILPPVGWLVCLGTMIVDRSGRRLGDLAAGTFVLHERAPAGWGWVPTMPPPLRRWAAGLELSGLDDELALAVRHFLARNRQLTEPARTALGVRLAAEVCRRTAPPPPPDTPGWAYLAAVLAERHRRAAARLAARRALSDRLWPDHRPDDARGALRDAYPPAEVR